MTYRIRFTVDGYEKLNGEIEGNDLHEMVDRLIVRLIPGGLQKLVIERIA